MSMLTLRRQQDASCSIFLHSEPCLSSQPSEVHLRVDWLQEESGWRCPAIQSLALSGVSVPTNSSHTLRVPTVLHTVSLLLTNLVSGTQEATDQAAPSQGQFTPVEARSMMGKMPGSPHKDQFQHGRQWMPQSALQSCLVRSHIKPDAGSAQGQACHQIRPNADKGPILQAGLRLAFQS